MTEGDDILKWGLWVYKIKNIERGTDPPQIFSGWKRYFMWINKGTIYYGDEEGKPQYDIPVAACRSAERFDPDEFAQRKGRDAPSMLTDFAWLLKTVEYTIVFVSDSESQCMAWIDGINAMLPRHQRTVSGFNGHSNIVPYSNGTNNFNNYNNTSTSAFGSSITASALQARGGGGRGMRQFDDDEISIGRASTAYTNHDRRESYQHGSNMVGQYRDPMGSSGMYNPNSRTPPNGHQRSSSYGNYGHAYGTLEGGGSGSKGFSQNNRGASLSAQSSPNTASLGYNGPGTLVVQPSEWDLMSNRHSRSNTNTGLVSRDDPDTDVVALGSWVQKIKGDNADKSTSWNRRYMWMEDGGILWYGSERGNKDRSINITNCESIERLTDEEMYKYKAPSHLFRYGLRLRMSKGGQKCWVFACESEAITVGWYKVWKKLIPLTAEELALEVQLTYEENRSQADYYNQQHRLAEEKRKRDEAKKKEEEERMKKQIDLMAKSMLSAAAAQEKKEREEKEKAEQKKKEELALARLEAQKKAKEEEERKLKDKVAIEMELQKRLAAQRTKDMEAQKLFMEKEVERRMTELKLKQLEEEVARKKKEEEDAKKAEEERQRVAAERAKRQKELEEDEARMAEVHSEMIKRNQKKESTGCCVIS